MSFEFVTVKHSDHITIVTLNRPGVMNALHKPAHFELHEVFNAFAADPSKVVRNADQRWPELAETLAQ